MELTLEFLLQMALILVVAVLWVGCIIDLVTRPDLRPMKKGLWIVAILILPIIGSVLYLITRPKDIVARESEVDEVWGQAPDSLPTSWNDAPRTMNKPYQDL